MSETYNESDALAIAKWCWPEVSGEIGINPMRAHNPAYWPHDWVYQAELILIERGYEFEYGNELSAVLGLESSYEGYGFEDIAMAATATLDVRVRAMAAVIKSLK